jgi:hypothetical protein
MHALPSHAGAGFKPQHFSAIADLPLPGGFLEVHAENYMGAGGPPHAMLERLRSDHALSIHGVGLSIGGAEPLNEDHLQRLKTLCARYQPESFSEHLAWSSHGGEFFADLLPLPYDQKTLTRIADHIDHVHNTLGRQMLLENPATYLAFPESEIPETDFLRALVHRTGCGLLLDINNVYVSAHNHGFDARHYLDEFPMEAVGETHLAGYFRHASDGEEILIDTHGAAVSEPVWTLYAETIAKIGPQPTLIEWDNDVPDWPVLRAEALRAEAILSPLTRSA